MAWPKTPTPEELIGMKPEELKSKLDGAASKEDVKAATDSVAEVKGTLAQIQESLKALTTPKLPEKVADATGDDDPTVRVLTDPAKFLADGTKDLRDGQAKVQAQVQEMRARQDPNLSAMFAKYGKELTEAAAKFPLAMQAQDNFWEWHTSTFLGVKVKKGEIRGDNFPALLGLSSVGPRADGSSGDQSFGFTPDMAFFLKERGVPLDRAARIRQLMHVDGEHLTHKNYGFFEKGKGAN
jgi:hypothetical protein